MLSIPVDLKRMSGAIAAALMIFTPTLAAPALAQTQPTQPTSGPGSSDYRYGSVRVTSGGSGYNAYYVFEPMDPQPVSAPIVVITHGYVEYSGYEMHRDLIWHTVRKGNVVVYPRYQTGFFTPCTGPIAAANCLASALKGVKDGIAYLQASASRVQPQLDKASYFGFSYGGLITANMANRWQSLGLPRPRVIFLDDPHDGMSEKTFDADMSGIPADVLFQCHLGADGVRADVGKSGMSCNTLFPKLTHIPVTNKNLVMTFTDAHGSPALSSRHGVSTSKPTDAYDWNFVWKTFDAMRSCALAGSYCAYGMGDTAEHRSNGTWSDGVSVRPLKIQTAAPIQP